MKLESTVAAVVTSGASGLGAATTRMLAANGVRVAIFDLNQARGEEVARQVAGVFCRCDVASEESVDAAFAAARAAHGQERILVNCAGTGVGIKTASRNKSDGTVRHHPLTEFDRVVQINLVGTFRCIAKSAAGMLPLPPLADGERGVIVNTAAAREGQVGQVAYSAAKGGIVSMTLTIARDLGSEGVRINTILPGLFETPLVELVPEDYRARLRSNIQFPQRFGNPQEYASMVRELCVNGEAIRLDGALRMPPR